MIKGTILGRIARVVAALALAALCTHAQATSVTTDVSDLWWNPSEDGWGIQLVQEHDTVFATLFVYDPFRDPTWAVAVLRYQGSSGAGLVFSGPLSVTTGPWFGGFYNPGLFLYRTAGTMTFTLTSVTTGTLTYSIDGIPVAKTIQRQTLVNDVYSGTYDTLVNVNQSGCFNPGDNGNYNDSVTGTVTQSGSSMSVIWRYGTFSCTFSGSYQQLGKFGEFNGSYTCTTGEIGTMSFFEMTNRIGMMSARLTGRSSNIGCSYRGRFTGLDPNAY